MTSSSSWTNPRFAATFVHRSYREMFYGPDDHVYRSFARFREFYFCGFEWQRPIAYRVVRDFDELVNEDDYRRV